MQLSERRKDVFLQRPLVDEAGGTGWAEQQGARITLGLGCAVAVPAGSTRVVCMKRRCVWLRQGPSSAGAGTAGAVQEKRQWATPAPAEAPGCRHRCVEGEGGGAEKQLWARPAPTDAL